MPSKADSLVRSLDVLLCKGLRDFGVLFLAHRSRDFGIPRKWSLDPALGKGCRIGGSQTFPEGKGVETRQGQSIRKEFFRSQTFPEGKGVETVPHSSIGVH